MLLLIHVFVNYVCCAWGNYFTDFSAVICYMPHVSIIDGNDNSSQILNFSHTSVIPMSFIRRFFTKVLQLNCVRVSCWLVMRFNVNFHYESLPVQGESVIRPHAVAMKLSFIILAITSWRGKFHIRIILLKLSRSKCRSAVWLSLSAARVAVVLLLWTSVILSRLRCLLNK